MSAYRTPREIQDFITWTKEEYVLGTRGSSTKVEHPFIPHIRLKNYFGRRQLLKLLEAVFEDDDNPVHPDAILEDTLKVFCVLVLIGKARFIQDFVSNDALHDQRLPFARKPSEFPTDNNDPNFFREFSETQYMFCAPNFQRNKLEDTIFDPHRIIPITEKTRLAVGGSADISKIKIHAEYDHLDEENDSHTYVLKTYHTNEAYNCYNAEVTAFRHLRSFKLPDLIGFYGSYRQDGTYNIILEFADQGNLNDYFKRTPPPSSREDIFSFWSELLKIVRPLHMIHESSSNSGERYRQGWHQDVKPANILVKSCDSKSPNRYKFMLADLGLSHFRLTGEHDGDISDVDSYGTRTYGAPECYRSNHFLQKAPLSIDASVDMWSFGCVLSEAAVWLLDNGWNGLENYREKRKNATKDIAGFKDGNCFHNGEGCILDIVQDIHESLGEKIRNADHLTGRVLDMIKDLLCNKAFERLTAAMLIRKSDRILKEVQIGNNSIRYGRTESTPTSPLTPEDRPPDLFPQAQNSHVRRDSQQQRQRPLSNSSFKKPGHLSNLGSRTRTRVSFRSNTISDDERDRHQTLMVGQLASKPEFTFNLDDRFDGFTSQQQGDFSSLADEAQDMTRDDRCGSESYFPNRRLKHPDQIAQEQTRYSSNAGFRCQDSFSQANSDPRTSRHDSNLSANESSSPVSPTDLFLGTAIPTMQTQLVDSRHARALMKDISSHNGSGIRQVLKPANHTPSRLPYLSVTNARTLVNNRKRKNKNPQYEDNSLQTQLEQRDHVFLMDDSRSMDQHQREAIELFGILAYMVKDCDPDGIELKFTTSSLQYREKHTKRLLERLRDPKPQGARLSDLKPKLSQILQEYQTKLSERPKKAWYRKSIQSLRPLNLYIFTDGNYIDPRYLDWPIKNLVEELIKHNRNPTQVGIQFIRFGNEPVGITLLDHLDSKLDLQWDVVDTEPSTGNVWKMLLGGTNKAFDGDPPGSSSGPHSPKAYG